jgi:hypothetical protein
MTLRRSSGSRRAPSAVDPTRSAKTMVSCRRSAPEAARRGGAGEGAAGWEPSPVRSPGPPCGAPQSLQNFFPGGFSAPHDRHVHGRAAPQSPQNRFPSPAIAPQRGQIMRNLSKMPAGPATDARARNHRSAPTGNAVWRRRPAPWPELCAFMVRMHISCITCLPLYKLRVTFISSTRVSRVVQ